MNKRGELKLRNIMFMALVFSSIIILASILVGNMADEYENEGMISNYSALGIKSNLGSDLFSTSNESISGMEENTRKSAGSIGRTIVSAITGAGEVLVAVFTIPVFISNSFATIMVSVGVPGEVMYPFANLITLSLYVVIIFVIISALPTGGNKV